MPTPRKQKAPTPPRRPPPRMEYRAKDGAWYSARVALQDESLRVMFEEFLEEFDEWHEPNAADLASPRGVAALRARFRPASPPLEDARCGDLRRGQHLCVFRAISDGERMYYDAVLDSVKRAAHVTVDGEERCACRFKVRWTDGPLSGGWDEVGVGEAEQGSPVQEPRLSEFLDRVTKSFLFRDGEDNAKAAAAAAAAAQGSGALSHLGGEENATAAPQATGATSLWGGEGKTAWIIIG
ncbi:hypothetical protein ZWY2020_042995 [Hordeum vulgare]|nr:hypothetical protein ZWY2020_042995 [Hordeum vulgare]